MRGFLKKFMLLFSISLMCAGCYHASSNGDDDLITTPVTNNPRFIPEGGGFGPPNAMPY